MAQPATGLGFDVFRILGLLTQDPTLLDDAYDEFCASIMLDEAKLTDDEAEDDFEALFYEWLLYDFPVYEEKTALQYYATWPTADMDEAETLALAQAAATNFCAWFRIKERNTATGELTLESLYDHCVYHVAGNAQSDSLPDDCQAFAARIARIGGTWRLAANVITHTNALEDIDVNKAKADTHEGEIIRSEPFDFLVADRFGVPFTTDGNFMAARYAAMSAAEREQELALAKKDFAFACERMGSTATWSDLAQIVAQDEELDPQTMLQQLYGPDVATRAATEEEIFSCLRPIITAWNLLPRNSLDGMSAVECYINTHLSKE